MRAGPLVVALLAGTAVAICASPLTDVLVWSTRAKGASLGTGEGVDLTASGTGAPSPVDAWGGPAPSTLTRRQEQLLEFREENAFKDNLALFWLPGEWRAAMPPFVQSWLRNWIMVAVLYYVLGGVWVYYTYFAFGSQLFRPGEIPSLGAQLEQMKVASMAMPLYAMLPAFNEFAIEKGWTRTYSRISDVGLPMYIVYFFAYMLSVEFFVYWAHRLLHEIKPGYRWLHHIHHKYNKEHTLSPFAGLAFHPIDGMLQACPYTFMLWFVPMHLLTHELLLFATGVWTNNIHDNIDGKVPPVMGAYYHTIHHTMYNKNYGHYFTFVDRLFGTLLTPEDYQAMVAQRKLQRRRDVLEYPLAPPRPYVRA